MPMRLRSGMWKLRFSDTQRKKPGAHPEYFARLHGHGSHIFIETAMTPNPKKLERNVKEHEQTEALLRLLLLGNKEIEQGKFRDAEDVYSELDKRIAEDEARPDDTIAWETIMKEAQARWQR